MLMKLKDKVAIVTGSSRGIGRRIAEVFAEHGAQVVVNYAHTEAAAQTVVDHIRTHTDTTPLAIQADVSDGAQVERLVSHTVDRFGRVDILVNNAGITIRGSLADLDEAKWDQVMAVNLKGPFLCTKAVIPAMESGSIINMSSIRGVTGSSSSLHYAVSKAGLITMTKSLAMELAPAIRVNGIAPGYTFTDLHTHRSQDDIHNIESTIPLARFGSVDDIANTALFLASDDAAYITGEIIVVSGGLVMR